MHGLMQVQETLLAIATLLDDVHQATDDAFDRCTVDALRTLHARNVLLSSIDAAISVVDAVEADFAAVLRIIQDHRAA